MDVEELEAVECCLDGCGLDIDHQGACALKPGGDPIDALQLRRRHLAEHIDSCGHCFNEESLQDIDLATDRYAAMTYDGSSSWLEANPDRDHLVAQLAGCIQGEVPWAPGEVIDLETGETFGVTVRVEILPRVPSPSSVYVVHVPERLDPVYVFATEADADAFAESVDPGAEQGSCVLGAHPVNDAASTAELIAGEDDDQCADLPTYQP